MPGDLNQEGERQARFSEILIGEEAITRAAAKGKIRQRRCIVTESTKIAQTGSQPQIRKSEGTGKKRETRKW